MNYYTKYMLVFLKSHFKYNARKLSQLVEMFFIKKDLELAFLL